MGEKVDFADVRHRIDAMGATTAEPSRVLSWAEICAAYPHAWLLVEDIDWGADGWIQAAVVVAHASSSKDLIYRTDRPGTTLTNTGGWSLWGHPLRRASR